jgi:uncharacterized protein (DUF2225 family)
VKLTLYHLINKLKYQTQAINQIWCQESPRKNKMLICKLELFITETGIREILLLSGDLVQVTHGVASKRAMRERNKQKAHSLSDVITSQGRAHLNGQV